jgi:hypothetical protein
MRHDRQINIFYLKHWLSKQTIVTQRPFWKESVSWMSKCSEFNDNWRAKVFVGETLVWDYVGRDCHSQAQWLAESSAMLTVVNGELSGFPRDFNSRAVRVPCFHFHSCCQLAMWGPPKLHNPKKMGRQVLCSHNSPHFCLSAAWDPALVTCCYAKFAPSLNWNTTNRDNFLNFCFSFQTCFYF